MDTYGDVLSPDPYLNLSVALRKQEQFQAAEEVVRAGRKQHYLHKRGQIQAATPNLRDNRRQLKLAGEYAEIAMAKDDWPESVARWQALLDEFGSDAPWMTYSRLSVALRKQGCFEAAEATVRQGRDRYPAQPQLSAEYAEIAMAKCDWPTAVLRWEALVDEFRDDAPSIAYLRLSIALRRQDQLNAAEAVVERARERHPHESALAAEYAEISMIRCDWPTAVTRWRAVLDTFGEEAPKIAYRQLYLALSSSAQHESARPLLKRYLKFERNISYAKWIAKNDTLSDNDRSLIRGHISLLQSTPCFSILMICDKPEHLQEALASLKAQLYGALGALRSNHCTSGIRVSGIFLKNIPASMSGSDRFFDPMMKTNQCFSMRL